MANSDSTSTSQYKFSVTIFDLYNEQVYFPAMDNIHPLDCFYVLIAGFLLVKNSGFLLVPFNVVIMQTRDLLLESGKSMPKLSLGSPEYFVELVQEKVENPIDFSRVLKNALQKRGNDLLKINVSHLYDLNSM